MKWILPVLMMFAAIVNVQAQDKDETPVVAPQKEPVSKVSKLDYRVSLGTSFSYSKGFGSGFSSYVAPELSYKVNPKFRVNVGIMFFETKMGYINYWKNYSDKSVVVKTPSTSSLLAYVSGEYALSNRLTISGTVIKDLNCFGKNSTSPYGYSNPYQSMSFHMDYKLTENITIGAGMRVSNGDGWNNQYMYNGYRYNSPYSNGLFGY